MRYIVSAISDVILPRYCIVCGRKLQWGEKHLCIWCSYSLPLTYFWLDGHNAMSDKLNASIQESIDKEEAKPEPYSFAIALYHFTSPDSYGRISKSLKYHSDLSAGRYYAKLLASKIKECAFLEDVNMVVPVPLHWTRRWSRGYNQAEVIAKVIAGEIGRPMVTSLLKRIRRTRTQTRLSVSQKARNVHGAFAVSRRETCSLRHAWSDCALHILLVDDVFTTGATLCECHRTLRRWFSSMGMDASKVRISVATLSFVG